MESETSKESNLELASLFGATIDFRVKFSRSAAARAPKTFLLMIFADYQAVYFIDQLT